LNKRRLGLKNRSQNELCEVSEEVSVWGENLEDIATELSETEVSYPLHVYEF
jgi:hypothetical protein